MNIRTRNALVFSTLLTLGSIVENIILYGAHSRLQAFKIVGSSLLSGIIAGPLFYWITGMKWFLSRTNRHKDIR